MPEYCQIDKISSNSVLQSTAERKVSEGVPPVTAGEQASQNVSTSVAAAHVSPCGYGVSSNSVLQSTAERKVSEGVPPVTAGEQASQNVSTSVAAAHVSHNVLA